MNKTRFNLAVLAMAVAALGACMVAPAHASIGTWSLDTAFPGQSGTTITSDGPAGDVGSSATWFQPSSTPNTNYGIVAPFAPITLAVGDTVTLKGSVTFPGTTNLGNYNFRFGLFGTATPAQSDSYTGYLAEVPQSPNTGVTYREAPISGKGWASTSSPRVALPTTSNTSTGTSTSPSQSFSPYTFTLTLTNNGAGQSVAASFISGDNASYVWNLTANDTSTVAANLTYNEIGIFLPVGLGTVTLNNVAVTQTSAVPEPASIGICAIGAAFLLGRRRSSR